MKTTVVKCALVVLCALLCSGCTTLTVGLASKVLKVATPGTALPDDAVVLIGRIIFEPEPVQKGDMTVMTITGITDMKRTSDLAFTKAGAKAASLKAYTWDHYGQAHWGEYFAFVFPRHSISLRGVGVPLRLSGNGSDNLTVHCMIDFNVGPDERVVYVGDLQFRLADTNSMGGTVQTVRVMDSFEEAQKKYGNAFLDAGGATLPLVRRLATAQPDVTTSKEYMRETWY
jgi:hypothetical protein